MTFAKKEKAISFVKLGRFLVILLLGNSVAVYAGFDMHTFSPGTTISSSQVNDNFTALAQAMPGMSAAIGGSVTLSTQWQNLTSLTVTPPMDGMLLWFGTADVTIIGGSTCGGSCWYSSLTICMTTVSSGGAPCNGAVMMVGTPNPVGNDDAPTLRLPATIIGSGPVLKNTPVTYYLTASKESGTVGSSVINGGSLTAIFFPGGYLK